MSASSSGPSSAAPAVADVAQLAGERCRRLAGRRPQQLDERRLRPVADVEQLALGEDLLEPGDGVVVARPFAKDPVVDELAQRADRRVLVADPRQQQLLESDVARFGFGPDPGNAAAEPVEQPIEVVAQASSDVAHRRRHLRSPAGAWRAISRWPISWSSPSAPISPADTPGASGWPSLVHPLGDVRIAARSATARSPRIPSSASSMP